MSEFRQPISQMMQELSDEARQLKRQEYGRKSEDIKREMTAGLIENIFKTYCAIGDAVKNKLIDEDPQNEKVKELSDIINSALSQEDHDSVFHLMNIFNDSRRIYENFFSENKFNLYREYLDGNLILPKAWETEEACKRSCTSFIIVPGEDLMTLDEMIDAGTPSWLTVELEKPQSHQRMRFAQRPKKFYTIAFDPSSSEGQNGRFARNGLHSDANYFLARVRAKAKTDKLNLDGLTVREYIWAQLGSLEHRNRGESSQPSDGFDKGVGCMLLGDDIFDGNSGEVIFPVAIWEDPVTNFPVSASYNLRISYDTKVSRDDLPLTMRTALIFDGQKAE